MDLLPFPLIRPTVLLLSTTLSAHFKSRPRDGLLPTLADLLFTATNSQHPELPHAALLKDLTHHLTLPRPSLTAPAYANVVCGCRPMGASVLCGADPLRKMETGNEGSLRELALPNDSAATVSAELAYKPVVFSLQSTRKLLLAIQALPDAYKKEREFLEYLLVSKHLMEEDEFHMVQAGRVKEKKTMEEERGGGGVRCRSAVDEALPSLSMFSSSFVVEEEEQHKYGDGNVSRGDARTISPPLLAPSAARVSRSVAASTSVPACAWRHWWEPVKTPPPATYHFDGDVVEEDEEVAEEEDREVEGRSPWNRGTKENGVDKESGQVPGARVGQRRIAKTIDIEWKDRPTFWGIVAQLRQRELVEATMQAFQLEEHELESSAMQSNVVVQQRVLSYLCSTSARIEPEYFRCPIPFLSTDALLSAAQAVALLLSQAPQPSLGTSPPPCTSSSRPLRCAVQDVTMEMVRKESSGGRHSHIPVLCRSLSTQFTPLFLLQHYLGEDTAWRWCAEAFLHLQTGRIAKAGATNTMTSGDGGNSVIVPAASSINAPTAPEELLSMERTLSSAPADLLPSFSLSASFSMRSGSSTSVSGGSSSTSISFLRVGAVYSTTLLLASLTKHWPQDILPSELLSSSLSSSLVGTAGCSDYFVVPNMRVLYEVTAILFALKPEESIPIPTTDKKNVVVDPERAACLHEPISTSCTTMTMQERGTSSLEASLTLAGRGVTTFIPRRVQTALQPVLRQTLWYFHSQSRLHDIADFYLFSSSWLHDFSSPAAPFRSLSAFPFDWRRKQKNPEHEEDGEESAPKDKLLLPDEEKNGTIVPSKEEDMEGEGIHSERDERVAQHSANQSDSITVKELLWVQQQCRWKGWLEHHVWLFPVLVSTSRSQLGAASGAVAAVSAPLCSFSSLGGGEGGGGGAPGSFTLPPPPKPTSLSASAAAALSLETLLSGLLSAVMLWQHCHQTRSSALGGDSVQDFLSSDVGEEMKSALQQSIQLFLRILSSQYLPPVSSSISSANRRKIGMASNWSYHYVVYLVVALNTMLFPSTDHVTVPHYCHASLEMGVSTPREHDEKVEKEEDEPERASAEPQKALREAERKGSEGTIRQRRPLAPLSYPDMAPLLEFCQEQLLAAESIPAHGYLSEKSSTREVSSLLLYASEILQSDVTALVEELRHPLGAQKAKRRRDRHQTVSSSLSQRALYPIYERCWSLVKSRATQGGFTSDALQLLLWKALTSTSSSCHDDPDSEPVHHYYPFVYSSTDTGNTSSLPPLMAISSLQTAIQQLPRRCERPMHS